MAAGLENAGDSVRVWNREFRGFGAFDLRRVGRAMDAYTDNRRILLQWVPHGYGQRSMNIPFCLWMARRHEPLDLMVHEPGLGFGEGGVVHNAVAMVHRAMASILLRRADRVFVASQAWERRLRPYLFGRTVPLQWLPVPSNIPVIARGIPEIYGVGYFGQYDAGSIAKLLPLLDALPCDALLMGRGSNEVEHRRAIVAGELSAAEMSEAIASCRVMLHLYPDGASGRRGTLMASLAHGKAVVTNRGAHTEPVLAPPAVEVAEMLPRLLELQRNEAEREHAAAFSRELYASRFSLDHTIAALTSCESR